MLLTRQNALLRALSTCAKIWRHVRKPKAIKGTALPPLSDHIARDIGLTPHERELMSHHWPSRDSRHPFL
ncbi:hypothetical protein [uncultured Tateyamaria sp.]|uniref:hypothetical protein n=1 Tax=uncultured Tateyamaria sp. TaxID=455651 RepID=UPI00261334E3|nr:hypothetical protein [uncultured Tateyamaria sp.]